MRKDYYIAVARIVKAAKTNEATAETAAWAITRDLSELFAETDPDFDADDFVRSAGFADE